MGLDWESPVMNYALVDEIIGVSDDNALAMLKTLARTHGLLAGPSSGAVAYAAQEYTKNLGGDVFAVMIFGDSGRAYLSKNFY